MRSVPDRSLSNKEPTIEIKMVKELPEVTRHDKIMQHDPFNAPIVVKEFKLIYFPVRRRGSFFELVFPFS